MARLPASGQMLWSPDGYSTQLDKLAGKLSFEFGFAIQFDERERQEIWLELS